MANNYAAYGALGVAAALEAAYQEYVAVVRQNAYWPTLDDGGRLPEQALTRRAVWYVDVGTRCRDGSEMAVWPLFPEEMLLRAVGALGG